MEFRVLGPLEVVDGERAIELGGSKQRSVLAMLVLRAGRVVSTEALVDGLWGDAPPATAAKSLQVYVSRLRKTLGDDVIVTRAPGYMLDAGPAAIDVARVETLVEQARGEPSFDSAATLSTALALWRGPALEDLADEPFAQVEVGRLEELRLSALEDRIDADLALGKHAALVPELEAVIAEPPLPRTAGRAAHARPLPLGTTDGSARGLSRCPDEAHGRDRHRARSRAPGSRTPHLVTGSLARSTSAG